jgi:hypothetical protein
MVKNLSVLDWIAVILVIVGGLNWGLVGVADLNVVDAIFGAMSVISQIVYILVGVSALYLLLTVGKFARK